MLLPLYCAGKEEEDDRLLWVWGSGCTKYLGGPGGGPTPHGALNGA